VARNEYLLPPSKDQAKRVRQLLRAAEFFRLKAKCRDAKKRSLGTKFVVIVGNDLERVNPAVEFDIGDDPNPN
jgi:hypothetical protein